MKIHAQHHTEKKTYITWCGETTTADAEVRHNRWDEVTCDNCRDAIAKEAEHAAATATSGARSTRPGVQTGYLAVPARPWNDNDEGQPLPEPTGNEWYLRVFRDKRNDYLRAGLYPTAETTENLDWGDGRPYTDKLDADRAGIDADETQEEIATDSQAQADILLGIAYERIVRGEKRSDENAMINVPARLTRWNARIDEISAADYDQFLAPNLHTLCAVMAEYARHETPSSIHVLAQYTLDGRRIRD